MKSPLEKKNQRGSISEVDKNETKQINGFKLMIKNDRSVVDFDVLPRSASKLQRGTTKFKALSKT